MKSLTSIWLSVAQDMGDVCGTSTVRDFNTVAKRVKDEGVSFLTITLTNYCKDFEKSLERGWVGSDLFSGFRFKGGLPAFLQGFLCQIFDPTTGALLDKPSSDAVYAVRQLTLLFGKVKLDCSQSRTAAAFDSFIQCENELKELDSSWSEDLLSDFRRVSFTLFRDVLSVMDKYIYDGDILPKHGPGATADRLTGNAKYVQTQWPDRLEKLFPYTEYALPNYRYHQMVDRVEFIEPRNELPVRVTPVPKTLKTPRLIAIEPTAMQYMQQALLDRLVPLLESSINAMGRSHIQDQLGFTDQTPNQRMALKGSIDGSLATLDLSEASDRVSNQLVIEMLRPFRWTLSAVQATRSRRADVRGEIIRLSKFASMGSALCFPIEAMVFLTVVYIGIERAQGTRITPKRVSSFRGKVRIYGDDIIIPVEFVPDVISALNQFGFKVNESKSFWTGKFRESCGKEYYDGNDVSVVRCRSVLPSSRRDVSEIVSTVSLRNQMYTSGCWRTARHLDRQMTNLLRHFPSVGQRFSALGRYTFLPLEGEKMSVTLHKPMVKAWRASGLSPVNPVDGPDALMKWFLKRGDSPFENTDHLERSGRPRALHLHLGWFPVD